MKLLHFFEYCFYRCASSKFSRKFEKEEDSDIAPCIWITGCQTLNITTIMITFHIITSTVHVIDDKDFLITAWISTFTILALINAFFLLTRKKYEALKIRYKDEKNKKLRGWGVVLYIVLSLSLGIIAMFTFRVPLIG